MDNSFILKKNGMTVFARKTFSVTLLPTYYSAGREHDPIGIAPDGDLVHRGDEVTIHGLVRHGSGCGLCGFERPDHRVSGLSSLFINK